MIRKTLKTAIAAGFAAALTVAAYAAGDFVGTWTVKDSNGKPFSIVLTGDGKATSTLQVHPNETGTWKQQGSAVVITWSTGWTSKIQKADDHYTHAGYKPGQSPDSTPNNTSDALKVK